MAILGVPEVHLLCTPLGGPPGCPGGCTKSVHFFGYLITLPVGTVFCLFFHFLGQTGVPLIFCRNPGFGPKCPFWAPLAGVPQNHGALPPQRDPPAGRLPPWTHHVIPDDRQAIDVAVNKCARSLASVMVIAEQMRSFLTSVTFIVSTIGHCIACICLGSVRLGRMNATGPLCASSAQWGVRIHSEEHLPQSKGRKTRAVSPGCGRVGRLREPNAVQPWSVRLGANVRL